MGDNNYTQQAGSITVKLEKSIKMTLKLMIYIYIYKKKSADHSKEDFIDF